MTSKQMVLYITIGFVIAQILLEPGRRRQRKLFKEQSDKLIADTTTKLVNDAFPDHIFES